MRSDDGFNFGPKMSCKHANSQLIYFIVQELANTCFDGFETLLSDPHVQRTRCGGGSLQHDQEVDT